MVLNELIEKYSINVISRNTRIAVEYLEALLERNCSKLKRVQAFGFISILEREYGVDLSALKKECKDYFESNPDSGVILEGKEIPIFTPASDDQEEESPPDEKTIKLKAHLNKILIALAVIVVAYASWQMFVPQEAASDLNNTVEITETNDSEGDKKGFFDSIVSIFKSDKKSEENSSKTTSKENQVWEDGQTKDEETKKETPKKTTQTKNEIKKEKTETKRETQENIEAKIIEQVKKEEAKKAQEENTQDNTDDDTPQISDLISSATAGVDDIVDDSKIDTTEPLDTEVPSMTDDNGNDENSMLGDTNPQESTTPAKKEEPKKEKATKGKFKTIVFHPRAKVWVGYTNLTTMKRAVATGAKDIKLDVSKDSYIVATGHGRVSFLGGNKELLKLGDGKQHFFKVTKDGVKEISHKEFQKLNKSKVW